MNKKAFLIRCVIAAVLAEVLSYSILYVSAYVGLFFFLIMTLPGVLIITLVPLSLAVWLAFGFFDILPVWKDGQRHLLKSMVLGGIIVIISSLLLSTGLSVWRGINNTGETGLTTTQITGGSFGSVYVKDNSTFLFLDREGKTWTVNYYTAIYQCHGTDGTITRHPIEDWLKTQEHVSAEPMSIIPGPGNVTVIGTLGRDGVFIANTIEEYSQGC